LGALVQSKATLVEKKALPCAFTEALTETFDAMAGHLKKKDLARLTEFMLHTHIRTIFDVVYSIQRFRNICPSHEYAAHKIFVPENFPQRMFQVDVTVGFETCQHSRLKKKVLFAFEDRAESIVLFREQLFVVRMHGI